MHLLKPFQLKRPVVDVQWSTDLCGCCDAPGGWRLCLFTVLMPAWQLGLNVERMEPERVICGGNFWGGCCLSYWLAFLTGAVASVAGPFAPLLPLHAPLFFHVHRSVQRKYGIQSNVVCDALAAWLTPCLLTCQDAREIIVRENLADMNPMGPSWSPSSAAASKTMMTRT
ncbi:hypothetical protein PLESTB_000777500 [Pleodorina starrii]|uniref:Uncharacterized protein n=1 Tax=Pleodorina starrii TaxID=330485 RepID=A0A9W6F1Z5_9CHLO|nr:hypothetical protein PLESTB_000777500 [Pleodorina starrii]